MLTPRELAEDLIGTCKSSNPEEELTDGTETPEEIMRRLSEFDSLAFICQTCDWWCGMDEAHDAPSGQGFVCQECKGDDDDE